MAEGKLALIFPGQGSQYLGMGKNLCDEFSAAKKIFAEADDALGFALSKLCFSGPESDLNLTVNTQPAILTVSIAALRVLELETGLRADFVAGHSLGEYSALVCAGALGFADAVRVVRERGCYMQEAVPPGQGSMAVILGLEGKEVEALCHEARLDEIVAPANFNGGGQIVIAGSTGAVDRALALAKSRGAKKVLPLAVSAPFHCELMRPAAERLSKMLAQIDIHPLTVGVVTNVEAEVNRDFNRVKWLLTEQAVRPVRWEESVRMLETLGCRRVLEVGPGKVLRGLVRRISDTLETGHFETSRDLAKVTGDSVA